jgi:hypothetical protein
VIQCAHGAHISVELAAKRPAKGMMRRIPIVFAIARSGPARGLGDTNWGPCALPCGKPVGVGALSRTYRSKGQSYVTRACVQYLRGAATSACSSQPVSGCGSL